jgi:hypothetical protein
LIGDTDSVNRSVFGEYTSSHTKRGVSHRRCIELDEAGSWRERQDFEMVLNGDGGIGAHDRSPNSGCTDVDDEDAHEPSPVIST